MNTYTTSAQGSPAVASDAAGNFVAVWESYDPDGHLMGIFGQRYDASGMPVGAEFRVNTHTPDRQFKPEVAMDATGNALVAWSSAHQDGNSWGVFGQRYGASGQPVGGEFRVNPRRRELHRHAEDEPLLPLRGDAAAQA